jgi:hypothetical protein
VNVQRFPGCNNSEDCIQDQGVVKNDKACYHLCTVENNRSVAVAQAGKIRGAVNPCLDLLVPFGAMPKGT